MAVASTSTNIAPLPVQSSNEVFLANHRPAVLKSLDTHTPLIPDLANIIAEYSIGVFEVFGAEEWARYFGVQVDDVKLDTEEFYAFWSAPDAEDPTKLNCDTHFPPILIPQTVTEVLPPAAQRHRFATHIKNPYDLETLNHLIQNPLEGYLSRLSSDTEAFQQNKNRKAGPSCFLVARKEVFARGLMTIQQIDYMQKLNERTGAGYEVLPSALELSTVASVHRVVTGERYLGNKTGMERRWTASRTKDTVRYGENGYPVTVGEQTPLVAGGPGRLGGGGLIVGSNGFIGYVNIGVVGLRKFSAHPKLGA